MSPDSGAPPNVGLLAECSTLNAAGLFYWSGHCATGPVVAESPRAVLASPGCPRELDSVWLRDWVAGVADPAGSPFRGLRRLQPGQGLVRGSAGLRVIDVSGPAVWPEPDLAGIEAEDAFREAFDAAVTELLGDRESVACEMSGGLDSTFVVASVLNRPKIAVHAFTHIPHPSATLRSDVTVPSDASAAAALVRRYRDRLTWERVINTSGRGPLAMARDVGRRAMWPVFGTGNLEWIDTIRNRAREQGYRQVWVGTHGNWAFSGHHGYAVPDRSARWSRRIMPRRWRVKSPSPQTTADWLLTTSRPAMPAQGGRAGFLERLAGRSTVHAGLLNPDAFALPSIDPFRHPQVITVAARIRPEAWRRDGMSRGFARSLGIGIIPDEVRLREWRGAQGSDVWHWMFRDRQKYLDLATELPTTPVIGELVDLPKLLAIVQGWPWGDPGPPPPRGQIAQVNRVLAFAQFIRDMQEVLSTL